MLLAGDIGGTKTILALYQTEDDLVPEQQATFKSSEYDSLEAVIEAFLAEHDATVSKAAFGVAGPVVSGESRITNLPWHIAETSLKQILSTEKVKLLNDLESIAYSVPHLPADDLVPLNSDQMDETLGGHKAVIAPGTGLGQAILFRQPDDSYAVLPSEGGHVDFAPRTPLEVRLLEYLKLEYDHVSYERVCSGSGMPNIYKFLRNSDYAEGSAGIETAIFEAKDPTPIIVKAGMAGKCRLCELTLNTFISILGSEAGNLALKVVATGGIYLGGGIPPRILPKIRDEDGGLFLSAFMNKGRFTQLLTKVPVYVILNSEAGLLGAAYCGMNL